MPLSRRLTLGAASLVFVVACSTDSSSEDSSPLRCESGIARSGDICQVNFFCDGGDGPAAYCSDDGACSCGAAVENPKEVTIAGICDMDREEASRAVNKACDFGL
jgi:hypothetical protein